MNSIQSRQLYFFLLFLFSSFAHAADIDAGKNKASMCFGCHGANGNSKIPQYPSLASQRATYIESQLKAFQSGERKNSIMQSMAANFTAQDIQNISAYFASISTESAGGSEILAVKGKDKAAMCFGCHGTLAKGRGSFPKLAGQQPAYIEKQLLNFKNRSRKGGPMNAITSSLSEQNIKELAAYLGSL
ncbi:MAG: c-type cytochrome [Methylococcaceae bacterium]